MSDVRRREVDLVAVVELDRLARSGRHPGSAEVQLERAYSKGAF